MRRLFLLPLVFLILVIGACNNGPAGRARQQSHAITIAGSTSVMPFTEKLAEYFMIDSPLYIINVQGGGSTAGIQACLNSTVEIGMSSRDLKGDEKILKEIVICYDGIAIVVNPKNPVTGLSLQQIRAIYSGKIRNWTELGWFDRTIDAVSREEGSGTRGAFEELVMMEEGIDDGIMVQDSNGSVKEVVATDPYAIGYISLGLADERVRVVSVDAVSPSVENIKANRYKIVRPFLYLTNGEPADSAKVFMNFVLSKEGQGILAKEGLVPAHD